MRMFNKDEFAEKLANAGLGYTLSEAQFVSGRLSFADADVKDAAVEWVEKRDVLDLAAEGWSVKRLESEFGMNAIAAVLTIDWLRKDASAALAAIKDGVK